ncbi:MAG: hypothetical protein WC975_06075 [Phycisphaerae bacterium]
MENILFILFEDYITALVKRYHAAHKIAIGPFDVDVESEPDFVMIYLMEDRLTVNWQSPEADRTMLQALDEIVFRYPHRVPMIARWFPVPEWWPETTLALIRLKAKVFDPTNELLLGPRFCPMEN